jgi:hypothetical protein
VLVRLSVTVTNTRKKQLERRKALLLLIVSELSVHGRLAPYFWACSEAEYHGERMW